MEAKMTQNMWTIELIKGANDVFQVDVEIKGDPMEGTSNIGDVIRDIIWDQGVHFQPIEDETHYMGWSRMTINIAPAFRGEEDEWEQQGATMSGKEDPWRRVAAPLDIGPLKVQAELRRVERENTRLREKLDRWAAYLERQG